MSWSSFASSRGSARVVGVRATRGRWRSIQDRPTSSENASIALPRAVQCAGMRPPTTGWGGDLAVAGDDLDVEHFGLVENGELDGLLRGLVEVLHVGEGDIAQALLARHELTELEQDHAQTPAAV